MGGQETDIDTSGGRDGRITIEMRIVIVPAHRKKQTEIRAVGAMDE